MVDLKKTTAGQAEPGKPVNREKRDIVKLNDYIKSFDVGYTFSVVIEGYYHNVSEKYGHSYLVFLKKNVPYVFSISGVASEMLYKYFTKYRIMSPIENGLELVFIVKVSDVHGVKYCELINK